MALAGCGWFGARPRPVSQPHYVLGSAYQAGGVWRYPAQSFEAEETGLAAVQSDRRPGSTADGEAFDPTALAGAHPTLQLPSIVRLTNLENGRALTIRLNDRGPDSPARMVAVTPRVASLLGFAGAGVARVRLGVLGGPSRALALALGGEAAGGRLPIAAAPVGAVEQVDLPPPAGLTRLALGGSSAVNPAATDSPQPVLDAVPETLTGTVAQGEPDPGALYVQMGVFSGRVFAQQQGSRVAALGPRIEERGSGRNRTFRVRIGPIDTVPEADRVLDQVIGAGVPDARIVVE